jgi:hypothetical protein
MKIECCAAAQGADLGLLWRSLRSLALIVWRAVTLPYADLVGGAVLSLTFMWVLVYQKGTPISRSQDAPAVTERRAA